MSLPQGTLGYRYKLENRELLEQYGHDPRVMLKAADKLPPLNPVVNPLDILTIKNQGGVSACVGFSLSYVFAICHWLATGRMVNVSAMALYIWSQRQDSIRGDNGATISGAMKVATGKGACLDSEWPFTGRYVSKEPSPTPNYAYRLNSSTRITDIGIVDEFEARMLPLHWGVKYGPDFNREIVESFSGRGGGGHAITTWCKDADGNSYSPNTWGPKWNGDGMNRWTRKAKIQMLKHPHTVCVGYGPEQMELPDLEPIA